MGYRNKSGDGTWDDEMDVKRPGETGTMQERSRIDLERFGSFIALRRREKGLTQKQLAEKLYVSNKAVSKWENGLSLPDIGLLEPLAEQLGVTVPELLHGERQESMVLSEEELRKWFADCDAALKKSNAEQREKRKKRVFIYIAGMMLAAVEVALLYLFRVRLGMSELDMSVDIPLMEGLPLLFGLWFFVLIPDRLPAYYDMIEMGYYAYWGMRINVPGVHFNNSNWPHILKAVRSYCFLVPVCWPVGYALLRLALPDYVWMIARLPVMLAVTLGGLFVPIIMAAKKYQ